MIEPTCTFFRISIFITHLDSQRTALKIMKTFQEVKFVDIFEAPESIPHSSPN